MHYICEHNDLKRNMNTNETYHKFLLEILMNGVKKDPSRDQGYGTIEAFGTTTPMVFDLSQGVPVVSTKEIWIKGIIQELLWFLAGDTNVRRLRENKVHFWDANAYRYYEGLGGNLPIEDFLSFVDAGATGEINKKAYIFGDLGRMYGYQWRRKQVVNLSGKVIETDPLYELIQDLRTNPNSRQIVLDTFSSYDSKHSALPPCHSMPLIFNTIPITQQERIYMAEAILKEHVYNYNPELLEDLKIPTYRLNMDMTQRSGDAFLGVPFNITSSALLLLCIAELTGLAPGQFTHRVVNAHIYENHTDAVNTQLLQDTDPVGYFDYTINWDEDPDNISPDEIQIDYVSDGPVIKAEMVV